jgi:hypothetical protein
VKTTESVANPTSISKTGTFATLRRSGAPTRLLAKLAIGGSALVLLGLLLGALALPALAAPTSSSLLPDHREYELVSLEGDTLGGEVYPPSATQQAPKTSRETFNDYPVRASATGDAIAYSGELPPTGGSGSSGAGGGDTFLATRGAAGWSTQAITPPVEGSRSVYQGFSSDLAVAFLDEFNEPLAPSVSFPCITLYAHDSTSGYRPTFTETMTPGECGEPVFAGVSADDSATVFETSARLTPEAPEASSEDENLYESVGGHVHLVNVLPNGGTTPNAAIGGESNRAEEYGRQEQLGLRHFGGAINTTGSRVAWTDLNSGDLYVRENPAGPDPTTVLVAEGAYYRGASADGSKILFTDERKLTVDSTAAPGEPDLYVDEFGPEVGQPGTIKDLTVASSVHANVQGVVGNSEDGSYVYFVAQGALAAGAPSGRECSREETIEAVEHEIDHPRPAAGCNFYVWHAGAVRFIATLSPLDNSMNAADAYGEGSHDSGDWRPALHLRTAVVTPDGQSVAFMSRRSLTSPTETGTKRVYAYSAATGAISCVSCNPSGEESQTIETSGNSEEQFAAFLSSPRAGEFISESPPSTYQLRDISANGARIFFTSDQQLVPQATSGTRQVYEWEREGEGTCTGPPVVSPVNGGCVFLLSSSLGSEEAVFLDADASGDNVFFTTRAQLTSEDRNEQTDVYDARVAGGFPHSVTQCSGTGCQGAAPTSPAFAIPSTVTFSGGANFPPPSPAVAPKKVAKQKVKCRKGFVKNKKSKCVRKSRKKSKAVKSAKGRK